MEPFHFSSAPEKASILSFKFSPLWGKLHCCVQWTPTREGQEAQFVYKYVDILHNFSCRRPCYNGYRCCVNNAKGMEAILHTYSLQATSSWRSFRRYHCRLCTITAFTVSYAKWQWRKIQRLPIFQSDERNRFTKDCVRQWYLHLIVFLIHFLVES